MPSSFSIEDFLEELMEVTEMNPFITVKQLTTMLSKHHNGEVLKAIFTSELAKTKDEELCLPELAEKVNIHFNEGGRAYPH